MHVARLCAGLDVLRVMVMFAKIMKKCGGEGISLLFFSWKVV